MKKNLRTLSYILLSIGAVILIAITAANYILENKLKNFVETGLPMNMEGSYQSLSLNILAGTVKVKNPSLTIKNKEDSINHTFLKANGLKISGISYWGYLMGDEIKIGKIHFDSPEANYYKDRKKPNKDTVSQKEFNIDKPIFLDVLEIDNAKVIIYESGKDSTQFHTKNLFLKVEEIELNNKTLSQKIPIKYQNIEAKSDSIFLKANDYDNLTVGNFSLENKNLTLNNVGFKTKHSRAALSEVIEVERDHYDLSLKSLSTNHFDFGYTKEEFYAKTNAVILNTPSLAIFRDKLEPDDLSVKPLYSQSLRELPFQLTVDSIKINDGFIEYEEKVKKENNGGSIRFSDLNATFKNVSNTYSEPVKTELKINAVFMNQAPISVLWSFDVQNTNGDFVFEGEIGTLEAEKMNSFTEPNLMVRLEGEVDKTYFTIDGNNNTSKTDMKINYSDFKISLLQKDGENKNKFLSAIVNIFISKNSDEKDSHYREASAEATRDKTKSIFNFLWISVKNALQKSVTG